MLSNQNREKPKRIEYTAEQADKMLKARLRDRGRRHKTEYELGVSHDFKLMRKVSAAKLAQRQKDFKEDDSTMQADLFGGCIKE